MRAVFVCDQNKTYSDFWESQARHMWSVFGMKSTLYYISNEPVHTMFTSDYAEVKQIAVCEGSPVLIQALFAKWYFPGFETDYRILICDIDCFLLSKSYVEMIRYETRLFHLNTYDNDKVPGYYVAGTPAQVREFFQVDKYTSFEHFCREIMKSDCVKKLDRSAVSIVNMNASPDWAYFCSEERYAHVCALAYTRDKVAFPLHTANKRIDRGYNSAYDPNKLLQGGYIDYHCPRPFADHKDTILSILRTIGSDV